MAVQEMLLRLPGKLHNKMNSDAVRGKLSSSEFAELMMCLSYIEAENDQFLTAITALAFEYGKLWAVDMIDSFLHAMCGCYDRAKAILATVDVELDDYMDRVECRFKERANWHEDTKLLRKAIEDGTFKQGKSTFETLAAAPEFGDLMSRMEEIAKAIEDAKPACKSHKLNVPTKEFDLGTKQ